MQRGFQNDSLEITEHEASALCLANPIKGPLSLTHNGLQTLMELLLPTRIIPAEGAGLSGPSSTIFIVMKCYWTKDTRS